MQWFRLYSRIVDDEKLRLLAFEDRWHFVALCCLKSDGLLDEPNTDLRQRKIAVKIGVQVRELEEIGRRLQEVGLVDADLSPLAWDELQFRSDNSTERVKKFREKQRGNAMKRDRNVSVAAQETETETDISSSNEDDRASDDALKPEHLMETWNGVAKEIGRPTVKDMTPSRRQLAKARIRQNSVDNFRTVFGNIRGSPLLRGEKDWAGCTFDWMLKAGNFQKILEGNYNG